MKVRIKRVVISPDAFFHIMQANTAWRVSQGIPTTARLRGITLDPYTASLHMFIEDESFPEIDVGTVAPILETEFRRI